MMEAEARVVRGHEPRNERKGKDMDSLLGPDGAQLCRYLEDNPEKLIWVPFLQNYKMISLHCVKALSLW